MRIKMTFVFLTILSLACSQNGQSDSFKVVATDTIIGSKYIKDEIAGSAYRKRAIGYFVIIGKDTSDFTCILLNLRQEKPILT